MLIVVIVSIVISDVIDPVGFINILVILLDMFCWVDKIIGISVYIASNIPLIGSSCFSLLISFCFSNVVVIMVIVNIVAIGMILFTIASILFVGDVNILDI